jgi:hypothetical protein
MSRIAFARNILMFGVAFLYSNISLILSLYGHVSRRVIENLGGDPLLASTERSLLPS